MGTRFELILPGECDAKARAVGEAALAEIEESHRRLSRFDPASLLSYITRVGASRPVPLDQDTYALFQDALTVWKGSDGAFDLTVPNAAMDALLLDPDTHTLRFSRSGFGLDLGGIAKGHALDLAARVLRQHGVETAFLHGGTSSAIGIGNRSEGDGWRVALAGGGEVVLRDRALSVSAAWEGNPHPTLDPRTGVPISNPRRAVVTGPTARLADAWSTAALVLGQCPPTVSQDWSIAVTDGT